jgi:hypothetical protein
VERCGRRSYQAHATGKTPGHPCELCTVGSAGIDVFVVVELCTVGSAGIDVFVVVITCTDVFVTSTTGGTGDAATTGEEATFVVTTGTAATTGEEAASPNPKQVASKDATETRAAGRRTAQTSLATARDATTDVDAAAHGRKSSRAQTSTFRRSGSFASWSAVC